MACEKLMNTSCFLLCAHLAYLLQPSASSLKWISKPQREWHLSTAWSCSTSRESLSRNRVLYFHWTPYCPLLQAPPVCLPVLFPLSIHLKITKSQQQNTLSFVHCCAFQCRLSFDVCSVSERMPLNEDGRNDLDPRAATEWERGKMGRGWGRLKEVRVEAMGEKGKVKERWKSGGTDEEMWKQMKTGIAVRKYWQKQQNGNNNQELG